MPTTEEGGRVKMMTARFHHNPNSGQNYVLIEGGRFSEQRPIMDGGMIGGLCLFEMGIAYSMRQMTPREISESYRQLATWINSTSQDEIPFVFREIFAEFKEAMANVGVKP